MTTTAMDAGPLGRISNPKASETNRACYTWMEELIQAGFRVYVPEIADYEVRRELLRADKIQGLMRLDLLKATLGYLPLTTATMLQAAQFWAQARQRGQPTADPQALDGDVILAAQALAVNGLVATENVGHLSRFVEARPWQAISNQEGLA